MGHKPTNIRTIFFWNLHVKDMGWNRSEVKSVTQQNGDLNQNNWDLSDLLGCKLLTMVMNNQRYDEFRMKNGIQTINNEEFHQKWQHICVVNGVDQ